MSVYHTKDPNSCVFDDDGVGGVEILFLRIHGRKVVLVWNEREIEQIHFFGDFDGLRRGDGRKLGREERT